MKKRGGGSSGSRAVYGGESLDPVAPKPEPPPPPAQVAVAKEKGPSFSSQVMHETDIAPLSSSTSVASNVVSLFTNKNFWIAMLVVLLILSFLGVNFVMLLGQLFQPIVNVFWILISQIMSLFGYTTGTVLNKTVDVVSGTAKAGIDIAEGTAQSVGNLLIKGSSSNVGPMTQAQISANILGNAPAMPMAALPQPQPQAQSTQQIQQVWPSTLDQILNRPAQRGTANTKEPVPDASTSSIQKPWCLVGDMDGSRTCAEVSSSNLCLSGKMYKTRAGCESLGKEGFVGTNGPLMMATPPPQPLFNNNNHGMIPGNMLQNVQPPPVPTSLPSGVPPEARPSPPTVSLQAAPTGTLLETPPPPPGLMGLPSVGQPILNVGPPNYINFANQKG